MSRNSSYSQIHFTFPQLILSATVNGKLYSQLTLSPFLNLSSELHKKTHTYVLSKYLSVLRFAYFRLRYAVTLLASPDIFCGSSLYTILYIYTYAEFPFRLLSLFLPKQYEIICLIKIQLCKFSKERERERKTSYFVRYFKGIFQGTFSGICKRMRITKLPANLRPTFPGN